jgi:pimeloyl-ACP methyl ester carboxylesterase
MTNTTPSSNRQSGSGRAWLKRILAVLGMLLLGVLAVILVLGLLPMSSQGLQSEPGPAATYEEAVARFQQVQQGEQGIVNDLGHSRLPVHGAKTPRVYVMVHGTTNSPEQWQELGETLYARGHNVLILRMPYHGLESHRVNELKRLTAPDLRAYADQAVDIAAGLGDEIVVVGISGGGAVASWMAQNRPEVDRTLALAPFFGVNGVPAFAGTLLINAFSRLPNIVLDDPLEPRRDWVYRGEATRGVAAFLALGHNVMQSASRGNRPAGQMIVVTTARDNTANNHSTAKLVDRWRRAGAEVVTFEFEPSLDIPHNSVDPAADAAKKQLVYEELLKLLGEQDRTG